MQMNNLTPVILGSDNLRADWEYEYISEGTGAGTNEVSKGNGIYAHGAGRHIYEDTYGGSFSKGAGKGAGHAY